MLYTLTVLLSLISLSLGAVFEVQVGRNETGGLATVFTPNQITAQVGDRVEFVFRGKNHTVTQSSFANPCTRQFNTATNQPGVFSGFMPVAANATQVPVFAIQVMDTTPQWFYCDQANHCNMGMIFAINAPTTGDKTFDKWAALAANATHPDPASGQTAPFTPAAPSTGSSGSGSGSSSGSENSGSGSGSNSGLLGSSEGSSFGSAPTSIGSNFGSGLGSGSGLNSASGAESSPTVFVGSIPASSATAVANAADTAPTSTTRSAGFKMEPRNVLGMAILGVMSFALAW